MNYRESIEYIKSISKFGSVLGLESIRELLLRLGNPQDDLKVVHIAGTNGKGSTSAYIESVMIKAGYKVGKYSSPAVFAYLEIFRMNGKNISEEDYAQCMTEVWAAAEAMCAQGLPHPTPFEVETALAFLFFKEQKCDVVILETGMGGETDATNVVNHVLCSVIVSISLDHMQFLGDTVEQIAAVKAGIIKEGCPVVLLKQSGEVMEVIRNVADKKKSPLYITHEPEHIRIESGTLCFDYKRVQGIQTKMPGIYQAQNISVAMEVLEMLAEEYPNIRNHIIEGIRETVLCGRFERISENPKIIIDGAHNPDAAEELKNTIQMYFTNERIAFIMGVLADKDYDKVAEITAPFAEYIVTVTPNNMRALSADKLKHSVSRYHKNVACAESLKEALDMMKSKVEANEIDVIIAFGSLSYLGELKAIVQE